MAWRQMRDPTSNRLGVACRPKGGRCNCRPSRTHLSRRVFILCHQHGKALSIVRQWQFIEARAADSDSPLEHSGLDFAKAVALAFFAAQTFSSIWCSGARLGYEINRIHRNVFFRARFSRAKTPIATVPPASRTRKAGIFDQYRSVP